MTDDRVQHGIDDNPEGDAEKGAALGGVGGAVAGGVAGSALSPVGTAVGAVAGGLIGAGASGAAVAGVDRVDNDNTMTGLGEGATPDVNTTDYGRVSGDASDVSTSYATGVPVDDNIQHGIDDNPVGDAEKGAALGGLGGAVVGAVAGSALSPVGTAVGAVVGGLAGAVGSGAAVAGVDRVDNDNTVTGVGEGVTRDVNADDDTRIAP